MFCLMMQGRSHILNNIPCQDSTSVLDRNGVQCIALADGAGSAILSHFGAQAATNITVELLCDKFEKFYTSSTPEEVRKTIITTVHRELASLARKHGCLLRDLASTLLFAAVKDNMYITGQLGDGVLVFCRNGELNTSLTPEHGEFINQTLFTTSFNSKNYLHLFKGILSGINGFFLMSDGSAESLYQRKTGKLAPIIKYILIASHLKDKNYFEDDMSSFFRNYILQKTNDDCSIASISIFKNHDEIFEVFDSKEISKLFYRRYSKDNYINDYINILLNVDHVSDIVKLSQRTSICKKKLKLRIHRLHALGFSNFVDKF